MDGFLLWQLGKAGAAPYGAFRELATRVAFFDG